MSRHGIIQPRRRSASGNALRAAGLVAGGPGGVALLEEAVSVLEGSAARLDHARALVETAATQLRLAGSRPRRIALSGRESLTPSERRVADLAAQDLSNKEIAQALFVTLRTVEMHLSNGYRKLGIASRRQLAVALGADRPASK